MTETVFSVIVSELSLFGFRRLIRKQVRDLWDKSITIQLFVFRMRLVIAEDFENAWTEGAKSVGISPSERTPEEQAVLNQMTAENISHLPGFALFIFINQRGVGKLATVYNRAVLWINRYNEVRNRAIQMSGENKKLIWTVGPTEHCVDCIRLNGKVKRASQWKAANIAPQSKLLNCWGGHCQCKLDKTNRPMSKGPLPKLVGPE